MKRVMIDIETLATSPRAVVASVGAVVFDPEYEDPYFDEESGFFCALDTQHQIDHMDRQVDTSTILWWAEQDEAVRDRNLTGTDTASQLYVKLLDWAKQHEVLDAEWWSHATFDLPILADLFSKTPGSKNLPWNFRRARDIRTLNSLVGHVKPTHSREGHHDALDDAKFQANYVSIMLHCV